MKKFILTVFILLIGGFTQSSMAQLQAPEPKPEELEFFWSSKTQKIYITKDDKILKRLNIPKYITSHDRIRYTIDTIVSMLNTDRDTFTKRTNLIDFHFGFQGPFLVTKGIHVEKGFCFNRETLEFNDYIKNSPTYFRNSMIIFCFVFIFLSFFVIYIGIRMHIYADKHKIPRGLRSVWDLPGYKFILPILLSLIFAYICVFIGTLINS